MTPCPHRTVALVLLVAAASTPAQAEDPQQPNVLVTLHVIQLNVTSESPAPATQPASAAESGAAIEPTALTRTAEGLSVFVAPADKPLRLGGRIWSPESSGADTTQRSSDQPPAADPAWTKITTPHLLCTVEQEAHFTVGQVVPYLEKRPDGSLVVRQFDEPEGLTCTVLIDDADDETITFRQLRLRVSQVVGRQPIPDVPFEVGRPIVRVVEAATALRLGTSQVAIFALPQSSPDDRPVFVVLRAQPQRPQAPAQD